MGHHQLSHWIFDLFHGPWDVIFSFAPVQHLKTVWHAGCLVLSLIQSYQRFLTYIPSLQLT